MNGTLIANKLTKAVLMLVSMVMLGQNLRGDILWNLSFEDVTNSSNFGFDDPITGESRRATVLAVTRYIDDIIDANGVADLVFTQSTNLPASETLASAAAFYDPSNGFHNGVVFDHATTGIDPFPTQPDAELTYNFGKVWNSELDAPTLTEADLFSVTLHELTHALGFSSLLLPDGNSGISGGNPGSFSVFDSFLERDSSGAALFTAGGEFVGIPADLVSNDVAFDGPNLRARNGGNSVAIYAPNPFEDGSSISHVSFSNALMIPGISFGSQRRSFTAVELGILEDIGWNVLPGQYWTNSEGGSFGTNQNWSSTTVPGATDNVIYNINGSYSISFASAATNSSATVTRGSVTMDLSGNTYSLTAESPDTSLSVDSRSSGGDPAILTITNGTLTAVSTSIDGQTTVPAELHVTGPAAMVTVIEDLKVGSGSSGATLQVSDGGQVSAGSVVVGQGLDRKGTILVEGVNSAVDVTGEIILGSASSSFFNAPLATGTMTIENGGVVTADSVSLSFGNRGKGTLTVQGFTSNLTANSVSVGKGSSSFIFPPLQSGILNILDQATADIVLPQLDIE